MGFGHDEKVLDTLQVNCSMRIGMVVSIFVIFSTRIFEKSNTFKPLLSTYFKNPVPTIIKLY